MMRRPNPAVHEFRREVEQVAWVGGGPGGGRFANRSSAITWLGNAQFVSAAQDQERPSVIGGMNEQGQRWGLTVERRQLISGHTGRLAVISSEVQSPDKFMRRLEVPDPFRDRGFVAVTHERILDDPTEVETALEWTQRPNDEALIGQLAALNDDEQAYFDSELTRLEEPADRLYTSLDELARLRWGAAL